MKFDWKYYETKITMYHHEWERCDKLRMHYACARIDNAIERDRKQIEVSLSGITQYHHGDAIVP